MTTSLQNFVVLHGWAAGRIALSDDAVFSRSGFLSEGVEARQPAKSGHWKNHERRIELMRECEETATEIREAMSRG